MFTYTFAAVTTATGAQLDATFNQAGLLGTIQCATAGTNTLILTPAVASPPIQLQAGLRLGVVATATNTGPVTANVSSTGALNVYKDTASGPAALSGNEIFIGN